MRNVVVNKEAREERRVMLAFKDFVRRVYKQGLFEIIRDESVRGMSGKFGSTKLLTHVICGRITFAFVRGEKEQEECVQFVADEDDSRCSMVSISRLDTGVATALGMIDEVNALWPKTKEGRKAIFTSNSSVMPITVAALVAQARAKA